MRLGSCGTDYLNDFFVLDTDPPPTMKITEPPSPQLYASRLRHFLDDEEFSDVTFLVEGRRVYGHKLVLSTVSDCFRASERLNAMCFHMPTCICSFVL